LKERPGALERDAACLAAELLAVAPDLGRAAVPLELDGCPAAALAKCLLEGPGQARLRLGAEHEPIQHYLDGLPAGEVEARGRRQ
jgi:hypothetical protein